MVGVVVCWCANTALIFLFLLNFCTFVKKNIKNRALQLRALLLLISVVNATYILFPDAYRAILDVRLPFAVLAKKNKNLPAYGRPQN